MGLSSDREAPSVPLAFHEPHLCVSSPGGGAPVLGRRSPRTGAERGRATSVRDRKQTAGGFRVLRLECPFRERYLNLLGPGLGARATPG